MDRIKELMTRYDQAQRASCEAAQLRKQLVPLLRSNNLTSTKFDFGDRSIKYHSYNDYENITQQLIRAVLREKYPQVDANRVIADICAARKSKKVETLRVQSASQTAARKAYKAAQCAQECEK